MARPFHATAVAITAMALVLVAGVPRRALAQGAPPFQPGRTQEVSASPAPPAHVTPPRLQHFVEAEYPADARDAGIEGNVLLQLTIDPHGHVTDATVLQGLGHGLDEAAVAAARQFVFDPATADGQPVTIRIRYRYHFVLHAASAQPAGPAAVLRGVVLDANSHPLGDAIVTLEPGAVPVPVDATGHFRVELPQPGTYTVAVERPGFRAFRAEEVLNRNDDLQVTYRLTPMASGPPQASASPDEGRIEVRGNPPPREVTRTTLDRHEITHIPGTGGDALRAIQNLPGLARPAFLSGALIVRGSSPADTLVFVDGTEIPLLYHFGGLYSVIQTDMLDRIDFYPGNFSARFGRAMGGIVDVGLRSPREHGYHGTVNISLIDASLFVEGSPLPGLSIALGARRSYVDALLGAVFQNANLGFTALPVYYDYQAVIEYRPNSHHRLRLAFFGDDDSLAILFTNPADQAPTLAGQFSLATRFHIGQLSWVWDIAPGTRSTAMASFGWTSVQFGASEDLGFKLDYFPINARYELTHAVNRFLRLDMGFDLRTGPATATLNSPAIAGFPATATSTTEFQLQPAVYLEAEITPFTGLRVVPGVRVDWFQEITHGILEPRVSFRYEIGYGFALRGGLGLYAEPPSPQASSGAENAIFPGHLLGNPHLLPQRATHYAFGFEEHFPSVAAAPWLSHISVSLEGFYKALDDLVVSTPNYLQRSQPPAPPYESTGIGEVVGMELLARYHPDEHFFGWIAYTLSQALRGSAPGQPEHPYTYDQTHILTILGSYRLPWGFEVGLRFRYVTGSLYTPTIGSFYDTMSLQYTPIPGPTNSARLPDFQELDLRVDKTWHFRFGGNFGIFLEVLNVYNASNVEGYQYNYNYTQRAPVTGLPVFPNLGIRGEL